jgi:hypothetical protein
MGDMVEAMFAESLVGLGHEHRMTKELASEHVRLGRNAELQLRASGRLGRKQERIGM